LLHESLPTLLLPVKFVAGGGGNPELGEERFEATPGLRGLGESGVLDELLIGVFMLEEEPEPRKSRIAVVCRSHTLI
jgi:hypothetical protein